MHQRQPLCRLPGTLRRDLAPRRQLADQVEDAPLSLGRIRKDLLVQPFDTARVEPRRLVAEEEQEKILEEGLDQSLEALVMIHPAPSGLLVCLSLSAQVRA
jgi:hypothetical protein